MSIVFSLMEMRCSYSKPYIEEQQMKTILSLFSALFLSTLLFTGCAVKKPYHYPNYEIIKPEKTCKPNRKNT